jgi:hypothetical protein
MCSETMVRDIKDVVIQTTKQWFLAIESIAYTQPEGACDG